VIAIAGDPALFTFLSGCGSPYDIVAGDGRLTIARAQDHTYDVVIVDAFSSDTIPVHLMTTQALALYRQKLAPGGTIVMNISNNHLDLEPVVARNAQTLGMRALARYDNGHSVPGTTLETFPSHWIALTDSAQAEAHLRRSGWMDGIIRPSIRGWTDQFSNILSVMGNTSALERFRALKIPAAKEPH
jgi:spermidine synthase